MSATLQSPATTTPTPSQSPEPAPLRLPLRLPRHHAIGFACPAGLLDAGADAATVSTEALRSDPNHPAWRREAARPSPTQWLVHGTRWAGEVLLVAAVFGGLMAAVLGCK